MNTQKWYDEEAKKWPKRREVAKIGVPDDKFEFVILKQTDTLRLNQWRASQEDLPFYGEFGERGEMIVRPEVALRLSEAAMKLAQMNPDWRLSVRETWRPKEIQRRQFEQQIERLADVQDEETRRDLAHNWIADPDIAGHPTGGAVDVEIISLQTGESIGFGTDYCNLDTPSSAMFAPDISDEAKRNRMLLRSLMMNEGFLPFDGEWWHYDFGNKEWALQVGQDRALYSAVDPEQIKIID